MENLRCKKCGGSMNRVGNHYECENCHSKQMIYAEEEPAPPNSDEERLDLLKSYISASDWGNAEMLVKQIVTEEPNNPDALISSLLVKYARKTPRDLMKEAVYFTAEDYDVIKRAIDNADKTSAAKLLNTLYSAGKHVSPSAYCEILKLILPYQYKDREKRIDEHIAISIDKERYDVFNLLASTFEEADKDKYIKYNIAFSAKTGNLDHKKAALDAVLKIDSENVEVAKQFFAIEYAQSDNTDAVLASFLKLIDRFENVDCAVEWALNMAIASTGKNAHPTFAKEVLAYYTKPVSNLQRELTAISSILVQGGYFDDAEYLINLILSFAEDDPDALWLICLTKIKARNEKQIIKSDVSLKNLHEYYKYINLIDDERLVEVSKLASKQDEVLQNRMKKEAEQRKQERKAAERAEAMAVLEAETVKRFKKILRWMIAVPSSLAAITISTILVISFIINPSLYKKAERLIAEESYDEAYSILEKLDGYKNSTDVLTKNKLDRAAKCVVEGKFDIANMLLTTISTTNYTQRMNEIRYDMATRLQTFGRMAEAYETFKLIEDYSDSADKIESIQAAVMLQAEELASNEKYQKAYDLISTVGLRYEKIGIAYAAMASGDYKTAAKNGFKHIKLPEGMTEIQSYLFDNCTELESIVIPSTVTVIKTGAFAGCTSLHTVSMGDGVIEISSSAFKNCSSLKNITLPEGLAFIDNGAFEGCTSLESIVLPDEVAYVGNRLFYGCTALESVVLSASMDKISVKMFEECTSLREVTIPEGITAIGESAFYSCRSLNSITIPTSVTSIGNHAFSLCYRLVEIINLSSHSFGYYDDTNAKDYAIAIHTGESGITVLENFVFFTYNGIHYLVDYIGDESEITLPKSFGGETYKINSYAFFRKDSLTSVTIPDEITEIADNAFFRCSSLATVNLGNGILSIKEYAFYGCENLKTVTIPASVTHIGKCAFEECKGLDAVIFEDTTTWYAGVTAISPSKLSDPHTAYVNLTFSYSDSEWTKR